VGPTAGLDDVEKRKFLTLPESNSDPSVGQAVTTRNTNYVTPAPYYRLWGTEKYGTGVTFI
jgi:hypothetical protein